MNKEDLKPWLFKEGHKGYWTDKKRGPHSDETKQKMRLAHLGKKYKPMSEDGRRNIGLAHIGKKASEETKKKMSLLRMGEKNGFWKGDKVGYAGLHTWVRRRLGNTMFCPNELISSSV